METITTEVVDSGEKRDARGRRIDLEEHRRAVIEQYKGSGLTQRAFAEREGIKFFTFTGWLKRYRGKAEGAKFAQVRVHRSVASPRAIVAPLEVALADGLVVRGTDVEQLVALVQRLRGC